MRVLITGASGFVGSALVNHLLDQGHDVLVVSRSPEATKAELGVEEAVSWDQLDQAISTGLDVVVHLAGETVQGRWSAKKARSVRASRIEGTRAIVEAIERSDRRPSVLLSASGIGFYGCGGETELSEEAAVGSDYFADLCQDWEAIALEAEAHGCRVCMLRFGMVLGRGGGAISAMMGTAKWGLAGPIGGGKQWWSWVALEDAVAAMLFVINGALAGPINVVSPAPIRQADFQRMLGEVLSRPAFLPAPAFMLRLILGQFADEVLASKRVRPDALLAAGFEWSVPDLRPALTRSV
jgi:uncharacterized protein (TIGR01777 family)